MVYRPLVSRSLSVVSFPFLLSACSTLPLQEDVTHVPTRAIVQSVKCEIQRELINHLRKKGFYALMLGLKDSDDEIADLQKTLIGNDEIKRLDLEENKDRAHLKSLKVTQFEREEKLKEIYGHIEDLRKYIEDIEGKPTDANIEGKPTDANKLIGLKRELREKLTEGHILANKIEYSDETIKEIIKSIEEKVKRIKYSKDNIKKINYLRKKREETYKDLIEFNKTVILLAFRFDITLKNNATGSGSIVWPIRLGTFTLGYNVGDKKLRESNQDVQIASNFEDAYKNRGCAGKEEWFIDARPELTKTTASTGKERQYPITGKLGLGNIISQYLAITADSYAIQDKEEGYSHKITFTTSVNGSIKPSFSIMPINTNITNIEGSLDFTADRQDIHEVHVRLAPAQPVE